MDQRERMQILTKAYTEGIIKPQVLSQEELTPGRTDDEFVKSLSRFMNGELTRMNRQDKMKTLVAAAAKGIVDPALVSEEECRPGSVSDRMVKSLSNELSDAPLKARQSKMDILVEAAQKGLISLECVAMEESRPGVISDEFVQNVAKELRGESTNRITRDPYVQAMGSGN